MKLTWIPQPVLQSFTLPGCSLSLDWREDAIGIVADYAHSATQAPALNHLRLLKFVLVLVKVDYLRREGWGRKNGTGQHLARHRVVQELGQIVWSFATIRSLGKLQTLFKLFEASFLLFYCITDKKKDEMEFEPKSGTTTSLATGSRWQVHIRSMTLIMYHHGDLLPGVWGILCTRMKLWKQLKRFQTKLWMVKSASIPPWGTHIGHVPNKQIWLLCSQFLTRFFPFYSLRVASG